MARHHGKALVFALSALIGLIAGEARGEIITFTYQIGAGPVVTVPAALVTGSPNPADLSKNVTVDVNALNPILAAAGSAYQFSSLGAVSDFPGMNNSMGGFLALNGQVFTPAGGTTGDLGLKITVHEDGFTAPTGPSGTLLSTTTGNFGQAPGGSHTSFSTFSTTIPALTVSTSPITLSTVTGTEPKAGMNTVGVAPVSTLYTLTDTITLALPHSGAGSLTQPTDSFGVQATITAVPEPASIVLLVTGMPLPLVVMGLFRRFRRQVV